MTESTTDDPPSTALDTIVEYQTTTTCRILGTDQHGREHCYWPRSGRISIRARKDESTEVVQRFDLNGVTIVAYRHLVTTFVENLEMEWNEDAFPR